MTVNQVTLSKKPRMNNAATSNTCVARAMAIHKNPSKLISKILALDKWLGKLTGNEEGNWFGMEGALFYKETKQEEPEKRNKTRPLLFYLVYYGLLLSFVVYGLLVVLSNYSHIHW